MEVPNTENQNIDQANEEESDEDGVELRRKGPRSSMDSRTTTNSDMFVKQNSGGGNDLDENGRIKAYVDFSHFHREWNKVHNQQSQPPLRPTTLYSPSPTHRVQQQSSSQNASQVITLFHSLQVKC